MIWEATMFKKLAGLKRLCRRPQRSDLFIVGLIWIIPLVGLVVASILSAGNGWGLPLSPGDRIQLTVTEGGEFSGGYALNSDGALEVPFLGSVMVASLEPEDAAKTVEQALIKKKLFLAKFVKVVLQVTSWAPAQVTVHGAVFEPGRVQINTPRESTPGRKDDRLIVGEANDSRYLSAALRSAGGVSPDADVQHIHLLRGGSERIIDFSGMFDGQPVEDVPLVGGDMIVVPSLKRFQMQLVRPSQITPPGIKVFLSNLTIPAASNANSALGNGLGGITFPYGARFVQAVVSANCAGGTQSTNANRYAVLVRTDPLTGITTTLDRPIEEILRNSDNESNPPLMANDTVACYDSAVTNLRDVFRALSEVLNPLNLIFGPNRLFK
jgi:polysaccharide biosynthesis/export protein